MTGNQIVAFNLRRHRQRRGWTQEEAARRIARYTGDEWSKKAFSAAERSINGKRVRQFHADEVIAFARAFEVPLIAFLLPPEDDPPDVVELGGPQSLPLREFVSLISLQPLLDVQRDELFKLFEEWLARRTAATPLQRALLKRKDKNDA